MLPRNGTGCAPVAFARLALAGDGEGLETSPLQAVTITLRARTIDRLELGRIGASSYGMDDAVRAPGGCGAREVARREKPRLRAHPWPSPESVVGFRLNVALRIPWRLRRALAGRGPADDGFAMHGKGAASRFEFGTVTLIPD